MASALAPGLPSISEDQNRNAALFPWLDFATAEMPLNHIQILWYGHHLWTMDGNYKQALSRVLEHFLTQIEFPDLGPDEASEYRDFFTKHLNYKLELKSIGEDFLAYGNCFTSLYLPFIRLLQCQGCGMEREIKALRGNYRLQLNPVKPYLTWNRNRPCPKCGNTHPYRMIDRKSGDMSGVRLNRFSPFEMEIAFNRYSQRRDCYWKIPAEDRQDVRSGAPIFIEETPEEVLESVASNGRLRFNPDSLIHLEERSISGFKSRGWGLPRALSCFRASWLQQTLNRADQAIAKDYTLGMRLLSPALTAGGQDPMKSHGMEEFVGNMKTMITSHRRSPDSFNTSPYPVNYQFLGGEGQNLLPFEKLKFRHQEFLSQLGVPLNYHQMDMTTQASAMGLKMFENAWQSIPALFNTVLTWTVKQTAKNFGLKETAVRLARSSMADDEMRKQLMTQLMAANQVSASTALAPFDLNPADEIRKTYREQEFRAKVEAEFNDKAQSAQELSAMRAVAGAPSTSMIAQQQQDQAAQGGPGGAPPAGGPAPGPGGGKDLVSMGQQAEDQAQQLVSMPEAQRKQQLRSIRESDKDFHALVLAAMERIRRDAGSQGRASLVQPA